ncbi:helix-turn-helix domain-containing protein [Pseudovibrio ascidiaceicola]|uniref:helix-turn-helix domain-containing protein n=1 Tax=Pseudovibrio ascidiaceicola TaxID=285279 RepID=UPI000D68F73B|nr:helix-turn-helix domain-containing protein [Pseudovibrio ascidiaceicola]
MTPEEFKQWRAALGFKSREAAANALGVSSETIRLYEMGHRRDDPSRAVEIPKHIALACSAIEVGLEPYGQPVPPEYDTPLSLYQIWFLTSLRRGKSFTFNRGDLNPDRLVELQLIEITNGVYRILPAGNEFLDYLERITK